MNGLLRWRQALGRIEELQDLQEGATAAPWTTYLGFGIKTPGQDMLVVFGGDPSASAQAMHDAEVIVAARNMLSGLLQLVETVLRVHEPVVDPDGDSMCRHCVQVGEPLRLWPCDAADAALDALEAGDPS